MNHTMTLAQTFESGASEWTCQECGRRFILQFQPYKRIVLQTGDEQAQHSGSVGGVNITGAEVESRYYWQFD